MLEIRNITKVYRSKTGEEVKALDNVSIQFPESGMVFILGKSGSGKSTLLNVMGGLDSYDSGEFVIKGKSSKDFAGSDFDAYRNTFIGFIFQEYNVLDDFTVGANIALALELQGKKATDEAVNGILAQVDLLNFAKRKPNELSGGQKQRVAIARALVKEPEIIMADEPTGALDSNTGKQIFDTLKALSKQKLVLIVSHDRDFAERYADRIVELADGKIIEDVTKHEHKAEQISDGVHRINDNILRIERGYKLTARDLEMINAYLAKTQGDVLLSGDGRVNDELRSAAGISKDGATTVFEGTDPVKDVPVKAYEKGKTKFIRSRLPMKNAVKMGTSGLKHKKFRLFMTILLSFISFAMFGLSSTVAAYENVSAATASMMDSYVRNASVTVGVRRSTLYDDGDAYHYYQRAGINEQDIQYLKEQTGLNFVPVYTGSPYESEGGFSLESHMIAGEQTVAFTKELAGLVALDAAAISQAGLSMAAGRMPAADNEIAITEFMFRQFQEYGFQNDDVSPAQSVKAGELTLDDSSDKSILGKKISFNLNDHMGGGKSTLDLMIVGVVDTQFDYARYDKFLPADDLQQQQQQEEDSMFDMVLANEIEYELKYGFHALAFATNNVIKTLSLSAPQYYVQVGTSMYGWNSYLHLVLNNSLNSNTNGEKGEYYNGLGSMDSVAGWDSIASFGNVLYFDQNRAPNSPLKENEVLISYAYRDAMIPSAMKITLTQEQVQTLVNIYGEEIWNATSAEQSFFNRLHEAKMLKYIDEQLLDNDVLNVVLADAVGSEFEGDARAYWFSRLKNEHDSYTPNVSGHSFKERYTLRNEMCEDVWTAFMQDFYGFEGSAFDTLTIDQMGSFCDILDNFYAEDLEYEVQKHQIAEDLRNLFIYHEYQNQKEQFLAKGSKMVDLLISSGSNSQVDSLESWNALSTSEKEWAMESFYRYQYVSDGYTGYYDSVYDPSYTYSSTDEDAGFYLLNMAGVTEEQLLSALTVELMVYSHENSDDTPVSGMNLTVVGFFENESDNYRNVFVSDTVLQYYNQWRSEEMKAQGGSGYVENNAVHADGIWAFAIAPMPRDEATVAKLAALHYAEEGLDLDLKFEMNNAVMATLGMFDEIIEVISQVFLWLGLGLAVFSSFLLMNFISTSISYKKREIGILRAVGARSSDVFKIFFSEAFVIAVINFLLATVASLTTVIILNNYMRGQGINITLLNFGVVQVAMMFGISVLVAALASFLPVYKIARKKPVDAIKDR